MLLAISTQKPTVNAAGLAEHEKFKEDFGQDG
jgi:hypothetical protein